MRLKSLTILLTFVLLSCPLLSQTAQENEGIDGLIQRIQDAINNRDLESYLGFFKIELRDLEEAKLNSMWNDFQIDRISLHKAYTRSVDENKSRLFLRAKYENPHSVIIEMWRLDLVSEGENSGWQIESKEVDDDIQSLYKIVIPSDSMARVREVEINHTDIQITFEEANVFFDNIPNRETALLVIGKGRLRFSPSLPREQHQLELLYGSPVLTDELKYIYIRCSNSFFSRNIKISPEIEGDEAITQSEINKAYSLFVKHYPRSYTIENSLDGKLLSFMPQGDEAVMEFEGDKIGIFSYVYSPFAEEEINLMQWKGQRIVNLYSPRVENSEKQLFISLGQKFDITGIEVDVDFRPRETYLSGKARIFVDSEMGTLDVLKFKLNSGLQILRINNDEKQSLFYTVDKFRETLYVYLPSNPRYDKRAMIEIFYRGSIEPNTALADVVYGPQYDNTFFQVPPQSETYLYTQSSYWYPAPADDDYFTATIRITVPPGYAAVSTGVPKENYEIEGLERVEDVERVGSSVYVFETKTPVKYLSFIIGRFITIDEDTSPFPLSFIKAFEIHGQKWLYLEEAKKIISFFELKFGDYPYESFTIVQRLWQREGGHSPPTFIVLNEMPRIPEGYRRVINTSPVDLSRWKEYYLAHEIAHQWWGQSVTWNSYHDQWLSEGLSQFAAVLYLEEKYGEKVLPWIFKKFSSWTLKNSEWGAITMGSRLSYHDYLAFQSIVYNKTALVLYMLKDLLGEDVFFSALREFLNIQRYSPARTREFFAVFERISGQDLSLFFEKWFDSYLLPEISVKHSIQKSGDESFLSFRVVQAEGSFMFPLWLQWKEGGKERREKILVMETVQDFRFQVSSKPTGISINPDNVVPGIFR
jgi:hypothetical protein